MTLGVNKWKIHTQEFQDLVHMDWIRGGIPMRNY